MKKVGEILHCCLMLFILAGISDSIANEAIKISGKEAVIEPDAIGVPFNKIILIREDTKYCAVKFMDAIKGEKEGEWYVTYEAYYSKNGDFTMQKMKYVKKKLSQLNPKNIVGRFALARGNWYVDCSKFEVQWSGNDKISWLYFQNREDSNRKYEMAPTKWSVIGDVDAHDKRLSWYCFESKRKTILLPLDKVR